MVTVRGQPGDACSRSPCVWCATAVCQLQVVRCWLHTTHTATEQLLLWASPGDPSYITIDNSNITYVVISKTILMTVSFIINNISVEL